MNDLSWFLYWAGIVGSIKFALVIFAILIIIAAAIIAVLALAYLMDGDEKEKSRRTMWWSLRLLLVSVIFGFGAAFVPPKETLYAIAASEVAEEVILSPEGNRARELLNKAMDRLDGVLSEGERK